MGDLDPIRELPYGPALKGAQQAGQMAASDQASELRNPSCAEGGVHRWEADCSDLREGWKPVLAKKVLRQ